MHGTPDAKGCILVTIRTSQTHAELCQDILSYLVDHPRSEDSIEGIVEWWLLHRYVARTRATVQRALTQLVGRGVLLERAGNEGRCTYCLNPRKRILARRIGASTETFL